MDSKNFTALEIDAIGEMLNISLGASATAVSTMLSARVDITTPIVKILSKDEFEFTKLEPAVGVEITYISGLSGSNIMLLKRHDVKIIVEMLMGMEIPEEEFELNEMNISAICEVMNQMMGASSTALSEFLNRSVNISTPVSFEIEDEETFKEQHFGQEDPMVVVNFTLKIADKLESEFINVMSPSLAKELVSGFFPDSGQEEIEEPESSSGDHMMSQEEIEQMLAAVGAPEAPKEPEPSSGGGRTMSQEEIEQMLAANQPGEPEASSGGGRTMSQEEIEQMLAANQPEEPEASSGGGRMMSQEEIERMLASAGAPTADTAPLPAAQPIPQPAPVYTAVPQPGMQDPMVPQLMSQMAQMQQQMLEMMGQIQQGKSASPRQISTQKAPNKQLSPGGDTSGELAENQELIMGVPLELSVEIGRTTKLVKEILEFTKGSLIILDKLAGEQVDLFVNGRCIAKGDVVVVEDNFGIRITEIVRNKPEE